MTVARERERVRAGGARLAWGVVLAAALVLLLPYLLAPLYRVVDPVSTLMLARRLTGGHVERVYVPIERLSPALPLAVLVAEDERFCSHHGIDLQEIRAALAEADDDIATARGGSTITQQAAKNLFLWPGRSVLRKALELPLALWIDLVLPKRRIMEIYLNIAEWGPHGEFGAEAGARAAFGKSAAALDLREAALMASILPNPARRSARRPGPGVRRLAGLYEARARGASILAACLENPRAAAAPTSARQGDPL
jgi:monofunctional biosynthetic peptidoglycan transglycosylase